MILARMENLKNAILATVVYYDVFDFPLMQSEIFRYLINPKRLSDAGVGEITHEDIATALDELVFDGHLLGCEDARRRFYFLAGRGHTISLRVEREKIAAQKWKKFLRIAKWFRAVPYLKGVFASGSLALNNTTKDSDFDVLVIAKSSRLYTCRMFLSLVASLFNARRKRYEKKAPDKFCFNHYITDESLNIKHESLFNAQTYINLKPIFAHDSLLEKFYMENSWLNDYLFKVQPQRFSEVEPFNFIFKLLELILNSKIGDWIETVFKNYQQKRIRENPATYQSSGRIIFTSQELEFHPRSFEAHAITRYNQTLKRFNIPQLSDEKDSGLL